MDIAGENGTLSLYIGRHENAAQGRNLEGMEYPNAELKPLLTFIILGLIYMCFRYRELNLKEEEILCLNQLFFRDSGGLFWWLFAL
jgi:hypothetical protein